MTKTELSKSINDLLDEIIAERAVEILRPDDVSIEMVADRLGLSCQRSREILEAKVKAGVLIKIRVRSKSGRVMNAYRMAKT